MVQIKLWGGGGGGVQGMSTSQNLICQNKRKHVTCDQGLELPRCEMLPRMDVT